MGAYIRLERYGMTAYVSGRTQGYRMQIQASDAVGMGNEIFVFQRMPAGAGFNDVFTNVASPSDMDDYPVGAPDPGGMFFRLAAIDLVFRNVTLADEAWSGIKNDVTELINTLELFENMELVEVVDFGNSSSSSSA